MTGFASRFCDSDIGGYRLHDMHPVTVGCEPASVSCHCNCDVIIVLSRMEGS